MSSASDNFPWGLWEYETEQDKIMFIRKLVYSEQDSGFTKEVIKKLIDLLD